MVVYVLDLRHTFDLSWVYPASCCKTAGIGSNDPEKDKRNQMDGIFKSFNSFLKFSYSSFTKCGIKTNKE